MARNEDSKILNFVQKRKESIEGRRRAFERIMFKNVLGTYFVLDKQGVIVPMEMVDMSYEGCLIQIPVVKFDEGRFPRNSELTLRMYFTKDAYLPVVAKVKHAQEYFDQQQNTYVRYGLEFDQSVSSFKTLSVFIDFLFKFAESASIDKGDIRSLFF